jgi:hypothetical protein
MPDGLGVIGFAALDQLGNLAPQRIGNRAAIATDCVSIANTFGPVRIADTAGHQFEGVDVAVRAVRETGGEGNPVESCVDRLDERHLVVAFFSILGCHRSQSKCPTFGGWRAIREVALIHRFQLLDKVVYRNKTVMIW